MVMLNSQQCRLPCAASALKFILLNGSLDLCELDSSPAMAALLSARQLAVSLTATKPSLQITDFMLESCSCDIRDGVEHVLP